MKYIIMSNGAGTRWNNHNNIPKQLIEIEGETLLSRTVRLIKNNNPAAQVIITTKDRRLQTKGAELYAPEQDGLEIDRFTYELIERNVCFLYGDTYYTAKAIKEIVSAQGKDVLFFGNSDRIFAVKIQDADAMKSHIDKIKKLFKEGKLEACKGWQLYQSFAGLPWGEKTRTDRYVFIDDETCDFNRPRDYKKFMREMSHQKKAGKRKIFSIKARAFFLILKEFSKSQAMQWVYRKDKDFEKNKSVSRREKMWAHRNGFLSSQVKAFGIRKENRNDFISERDYRYLAPINGKYNKWINDFILRNYIFMPFSEYFFHTYYQINNRDGQRQIIPLPDCPREYGDSVQDIVRLAEEKSISIVRQHPKMLYRVEYNGQDCVMNGRKTNSEALKNLLMDEASDVLLVSEALEQETEETLTIQLVVMNDEGSQPIISDVHVVSLQRDGDGDEGKKSLTRADADTGEYFGAERSGTIPQYPKIKEQIRKMALFVPQIEFMGATILITQDRFKIMQLTANPRYEDDYIFSEKSTAYLRAKLKEKKDSRKKIKKQIALAAHKIKLRIRRRFTRLLYPKAYLPYLGVRWISLTVNDFFVNRDTTVKQKLWAYRNGFLSYRLEQYGITKENRLAYISDFEYLWLRHINSKDRICFEDKITAKYIIPEYKHCFPEYYYHIILKHGKNKIIPMMDCPAGYAGSYEDIFRLVKEKKVLALKPDEGSHGEGFFKFSYENDKFYLNSEEATKEQIKALFENVDNQYIITEYIQMHSALKKIYDGAVNTIRIIVFKKDGKTPQIGNAYMRFGSKRTGAVDNMGAGGIFAQIDIDTGRFHSAKIIEKNCILPCERHPDTDVVIGGILPNWEKTKELILNVAKAVPLLEYFGFDVALTEDGVKFPEINRFPDYPKIEKLSPMTIDYLLYKLEKKKARYGYNTKRPLRVFSLPKRPFTGEEEKQQSFVDDELSKLEQEIFEEEGLEDEILEENS